MEIPCKNCITLPICIVLAKKKFSISHILEQKCSLFKDYVKFSIINKNLNYARKEFYEVFGEWNFEEQKRIFPKNTM